MALHLKLLVFLSLDAFVDEHGFGVHLLRKHPATAAFFISGIYADSKFYFRLLISSVAWMNLLTA